jgi:hypothetical protein
VAKTTTPTTRKVQLTCGHSRVLQLGGFEDAAANEKGTVQCRNRETPMKHFGEYFAVVDWVSPNGTATAAEAIDADEPEAEPAKVEQTPEPMAVSRAALPKPAKVEPYIALAAEATAAEHDAARATVARFITAAGTDSWPELVQALEKRLATRKGDLRWRSRRAADNPDRPVDRGMKEGYSRRYLAALAAEVAALADAVAQAKEAAARA